MKTWTNTLYAKIKEDIKSRIEAGEYCVGERIMSEAEICARYQVSRISAKRALNELRNEGYIIRVPGKGSFVSFPQIEYNLENMLVYDMESEIESKGMRYSAKLLYFGRIKASDVPDQMGVKTRTELNIQENVPLYYIQKLHYANKEIVALDNIFIPCEFCKELSEDDVLLDKRMKQVLEQVYNIRIRDAKVYFYARPVTPQQAEWLQVNPGSAALVTIRVGYSESSPVEFLYRIYKGERCMYSANLSAE